MAKTQKSQSAKKNDKKAKAAPSNGKNSAKAAGKAVKAAPIPEAAKPKAVAAKAPEQMSIPIAPPPAVEAAPEDDDDIILTDAEGNRYCRVRDCDQISVVDSYCRYHYLLLWKRIQIRKKILTDGKLEYYVVELTSRYPDKFLEMIRKDLRTQKDFLSAIQELEIDESGLENEFEEEEDTQAFIDEVRGSSLGETETVEDEF